MPRRGKRKKKKFHARTRGVPSFSRVADTSLWVLEFHRLCLAGRFHALVGDRDAGGPRSAQAPPEQSASATLRSNDFKALFSTPPPLSRVCCDDVPCRAAPGLAGSALPRQVVRRTRAPCRWPERPRCRPRRALQLGCRPRAAASRAPTGPGYAGSEGTRGPCEGARLAR